MKEQYLEPGEVIRWSAPQAAESYFVAGLRENGKPARPWPVWLRVLGFPFKMVWIAFIRIVDFFACLSDFDFSDFPRKKSQPAVLVFGESPKCMAVFRSRPSFDAGIHGVWMLTNHRIVAATFESGRFRVDFEILAEQIRFQPNIERRFSRKFRPRVGTYHRILLPDGSGFEIAPGAMSIAQS
ncbi:hypothetical protein O1R50_18050 [Glycomyces luteolus]|uniref:Uncharacterized protein n=1 Tax=Glycomyces luteolus TaxID=2670330 RepID=A0A9X3PA04_9ACTN|nr:hypothetical protein [Glycomyces luteolus]MDA1361536.1 hypothetical protein [Glycomyces luteolus]